MKKHIRITSTGQKIKRTICPAGKKAMGNSCVPMKSSEKLDRMLGARKMARSKQANQGKMKMAVRAMLKARKKRKARGLGG